MKYTVRHRVVTDYLRDVEAESKEEAIRKAKYCLSSTIGLTRTKSEVADLGWTADVEDQDKEVGK